MEMLMDLLYALRTPIAPAPEVTVEKYHGDLTRRICLLTDWEIDDALGVEQELAKVPHVTKVQVELEYIEIQCEKHWNRWSYFTMQRIERIIAAHVRDYRHWQIVYRQRASMFDPEVALVMTYNFRGKSATREYPVPAEVIAFPRRQSA